LRVQHVIVKESQVLYKVPFGWAGNDRRASGSRAI
jgi:hypothetical protein